MIQLRIHKESDLYSPYDPAQIKINDKVYHYLKTFCTDTEYQKHIHDTLRVITDSPIDSDRLRSALQAAVEKDSAEFDKQLAINNRRAIWAYIVGIILSAAGVAFSLITDQVLLAIISFFGTMTLSDGVAIHTKINPDIKRLKRHLDPLRDFTLEVVSADAPGAELPKG